MSRTLAAVALAGLVQMAPGVSHAGDEVDYSAPYVTVENGELVTKYPPKAHTPDPRRAATTGGADAAASDQEADVAAAAGDGDDSRLPLAIGVAAGVGTAIALLVAWRRRRSDGRSAV